VSDVSAHRDLPPRACAASLPHPAGRPRGLAKRVIACLDVRANDSGDLVVTKGDQYDVRESSSGGEVGAGSGSQGWGWGAPDNRHVVEPCKARRAAVLPTCTRCHAQPLSCPSRMRSGAQPGQAC
jgi:hypothetical protein